MKIVLKDVEDLKQKDFEKIFNNLIFVEDEDERGPEKRHRDRAKQKD